MSDRRGEMTSRAIAITTALCSDPDNVHAATPTLHSYIEEGVPDAELLVGFSNLVLILLTRVEKLAARPALEELQYIARRYGA